MTTTSRAVNRARLSIVSAAVLWSLSGLLTRVLQRDTPLGVNHPALTPLQIAFYRAVFAGLVIVPLLRSRHLTFRPQMILMVGFFAGMNASFLTAMALGSAANAIFLQNTAPFWVYLICVFILGEHADRKNLEMIMIGMLGIGIIMFGGWQRDGFERLEITAMGLVSAITYSGVIVCLRELKNHSSMWLTAMNHLGSAIVLGSAVAVLYGPAFWLEWVTTPTSRQLVFLAFFGAVQMGLPYVLFAHGLKHVSPQEAGMIALIEPLLNPLWAYLISPETDTPPLTTWLGGGLILGALSWRYLFTKIPVREGEPQLPEIID